MSANTPLRLNIGLVPDSDTGQQAIAASQLISKQFKTLYQLDEQTTLAHLTLFTTTFDPHQVNPLADAIERIAKQISPFQLPPDHWGGGAGWVCQHYAQHPMLTSLHQTCVEAAQPLRVNLPSVEDYEADYQVTLSAHKRKRLQQYGYHSVLGDYQPHLCITRLGQPDQTTSAHESLISTPWPNFQATRLALFQMGQHGVCHKTITTFDFASQ